MAFAFSISDRIDLSSDGLGRRLVIGSCTNGAGDSGGVIQDAANGLRRILYFGFSCYSGEQAPQVVKSYDHATYDGDILTITTQLGADYNFWIVGENAGA